MTDDIDDTAVGHVVLNLSGDEAESLFVAIEEHTDFFPDGEEKAQLDGIAEKIAGQL